MQVQPSSIRVKVKYFAPEQNRGGAIFLTEKVVGALFSLTTLYILNPRDLLFFHYFKLCEVQVCLTAQ